MRLSENQLFDGRYLLVELIGRGASAEVWKAVDTKAGNMPVAVKIYKPDTLGPGSAGIAEFQREFTMVYNMTHTNLLHPQGFDICEGSPYLVMAYCENGSATSMVGRFDENDLLQFLRDVAAGLEYLHDHNITHQDIKPDNILVDDNCNYMVTDFGISRRESANDAIGGTRAYMAPEVYRGKPEHASDIWSLGATALELLTGQPPYGELGGAAQAQNPGAPKINARLSQPVRDMVTDMLNPDPRKRPSAASIRARIDHFRETGSWNRNNQRNRIAYIATAVASVLLCVGLFFWDHTRTKVRYYKDYTEIWGVPQGIGRVSAMDQKHRATTYRMEYRGGKLRRMMLVNALGYFAPQTDTELKSKLQEAEYFYTNDGQIDYVKAYDQGGACIYVLDYDANLRTAIFKCDDEYGTEKPLLGKTSETDNALAGMAVETSPITRYKISYDDKGRFSKIEYATFQNVDVTDDDMIHGMTFEYDDRDRMTKKTTIGLDGQPRGNKRALAVKTYGYDDDDNWTEIRYMTVDGSPSSDGTGVAMVRYEYDGYGNPVSEKYFNLEGEPALYSEMNMAGVLYERNSDGSKLSERYIGLDGKPTFLPQGFGKHTFEYDEYGHICRENYLDDRDSLVNANFDGSLYAYEVYQSNPRGVTTDMRLFDRLSQPAETSEGVHHVALTIDSVGHITEIRNLDKADKPRLMGGFYSTIRYEYDKLGRQTAMLYFDDKDQPTADENGVAVYRDELDNAGKVRKRSLFGPDGKPALHKDRYSVVEYEYDQRGNEITQKIFGPDGKPMECMAGWQTTKNIYDPVTNYFTGYFGYNAAGVQINGAEYKYDDRGNLIEQRFYGAPGKLKPGTAVEHMEYDANNRVTRIWYTNEAGNKVNCPENSYCEERRKYDERGNICEQTFWSISAQPAATTTKVHRIIKEYDSSNRMSHWVNLGVDGKPIPASEENAPEVRYEYDARGNRTLHAIFDGHGNPAHQVGGWQKNVMKYDNRNRLIDDAYFNKDGAPVVNKSVGFYRVTYQYDDHGNVVREEQFDTQKLIQVVSRKYNRRDQITEESYKDANGNPPAGKNSKVTIEYEADDITPKKLTVYDNRGKLLGWMMWNKSKNAWGDPQFPAGAAPAQVYNSYSSDSNNGSGSTAGWQAECRALASQCPVDCGNGVLLQSVSTGSSSVTMTYKLTEISLYEMDDSQKSALRAILPGMKAMIAESVPSYVSVNIVLLDKAGRRITF